jgi:hypothetical protein
MRIYLPEEELDVPIVICSEFPHNEGSSVTSATEQLTAEVVRYNKLPTPIGVDRALPS